MKKLAIFAVLLVVAFVQLKMVLTNGKALRYFDARPNQRGTALALYTMGNFYELTNNYPMAEKTFKVIMDKYPKYRYAMESAYGHAYAIEMQKDRGRAIEAYQKFLEVYPDSRRSQTVRNNIDILR